MNLRIYNQEKYEGWIRAQDFKKNTSPHFASLLRVQPHWGPPLATLIRDMKSRDVYVQDVSNTGLTLETQAVIWSKLDTDLKCLVGT